MLASTRRLVCALAFLSACSGTIGEPSSRVVSEDGQDGGRVTSGRHGRADGGVVSSRSDGGVTSGTLDSDVPPTEHSVANACGDAIELPLAHGLRVTDVSLYQTVEAKLYEKGAWVRARAVPVVQGKQALVRVFVEPLAGYERHPVRALLTLERGATATVLEDERTIMTASSLDDLASTFLFRVPGELLRDDTAISVALYERECEADAGAARDVRVPAQGTAKLAAEPTGALKVVIVPISLNGRLPNTSAAELERMRAYLLSYYPVSSVELRVRNRPLSWTASLRGTDSRSWSSLLSQLSVERRTDAPASDVYYFGLVQPAESFRSYCGTGCILGIAPQTTSVMASMQVALGASFSDPQSYETMVHELGHAHGRGHAPCTVGGTIQGVDERFPDGSGATTSWGWDSRTDRLMPPTSKDIMGYCQPNWISGYTYLALAQRALQVNSRALVVSSPDATRWHQLLLHGDGSAQWGGAIELLEPAGTHEPAIVRDAQGQIIAELDAVRIPLADTDEAFVYLPEPGPRWHTVTLGRHTLALSAITAAP